MTTINRLLVANRGEIARRVFRTCADLGIATVAVYADPDAGAPFVTDAQLAVHLPGSAATDTYLRSDAIIDAARRTGADAIHPGYGFLSEDADFARAVTDAGLTWIGPTPDAIEQMGSKIAAKTLMADAGVPVLDRLDLDRIGPADLPVLVKASAGGGGRGMRVVTDLAALADEIAAAEGEARRAFGDPAVFCERYLPTGHHVEVQILADTHGTVWVVGERECSIQRRHQKIIEEAPAPLVQRTDGMRRALFEAAGNAAAAIGYVGAGTVEFLATDDGRFYFLEMNTRLQVEHPVTEATTGVDLVAWQVRIAEGAALGDAPPPTIGHAVEARLYAEDPAADWRPATGRLHTFDVPGVTVTFAPDAQHPTGLRLDSGVADGSVVGVHYDPMLAKVVAWAPDRAAAIRRLAAALRRARIHGLVTNRDLLVRILEHDAFAAGATDTSFLDAHGLDVLAAPLLGRDDLARCVTAAALAEAAEHRRDAPVLASLPPAWRNVPSTDVRKRYVVRGGPRDGDEIEATYRSVGGALRPTGIDGVEVLGVAPDTVTLRVDGVRREFRVGRSGALVSVDTDTGSVTLERVPRFVEPGAVVAPGSLVSPMPGTVVRIAVAEGDRVARGRPLVWIEAMKMQHELVAPVDGVVASLGVAVGDQVDAGQVLARLDETSTKPQEQP